jgi:NTP pyrophosphatase (non-canonical NTP hydrolase)
MAKDQPLKTYGPYDKELAIFSSIMRWKLEKNAHKGRWEDLGLERALELLDAEVSELREAVNNRRMHGTGTPDIMLEAADVANQALILAMIVTNPPIPVSPKVRDIKKELEDKYPFREGDVRYDNYGHRMVFRQSIHAPGNMEWQHEPEIKNLHPATIGLKNV